VNGHKSKYKDEGIVKVMPNAYYKMLIHVLRYGSMTRDKGQYKEVMGMLIGRLEGEGEIKNVVIEDAVPVSHGGSIEVSFAPEDYVTFSMIDEQYAKKNWFTVGWYHSHPGLEIFFSSTDIQNQLGWQNANPSAVGIVFDHTYLEKENDMGFRTFRLDEPSKGLKTDYHEVKTIVKPPDDINFYLKLIGLIESVHTKEPPILEINETPSLFGNITIPSEGNLKAKKPNLDYSLIYTSLRDGLLKLIEESFNPIIQFLNKSSQEIIKDVVTTNLRLRENLLNLKNDLSNGIKDLQNSLKNQLTSKLNQIDIFLEEKFEKINVNRSEIKTKVNQIEERLIEVNENFNNKIETEIKPILSALNNKSELVNEVNDILTENFERLHSEKENLIKNKEVINNLKDVFISNFAKFEEKIGFEVDKALQSYSTKIEKIKEDERELLEKVKESHQKLNNKRKKFNSLIDKLENENKELHNKTDELSSIQKNLNRQLEEKTEKIDWFTKNLEKERGEKVNLEKKLEKLTQEKERIEEELEKMRKENKKIKKQLQKQS